MLVSGHSEYFLSLTGLLPPVFERTCELGTQYVSLEKETNQLRLDLEVEKRNVARVQVELKTMGETMKQALVNKDNELAGAQKVAREKTKAAEEKLASFEKLEGENKSLKTVVEEMKKEVAELKKQQTEWGGKFKAQANAYEQEKKTLSEKITQLTQKKDSLEKYIEDFTEEMYTKLAEYCRDFELETDRIEKDLDPTRSLVRDKAALGILRLESCLDDALGYIIRLRGALGRIDKELWPEDMFETDLEAMMTRLNQVPSRVQAWKKSAARCGADVALSPVRVHCKDAKKEKLKSLQVANTKKLKFEDFMETFIEAATWIADGIHLDSFVEPASPSGA